MNAKLEPRHDSDRATVMRPRWIVAGAVLALLYPALSLAIAIAWDRGLVELDPNGPFVQTIQRLGVPALLLAPIGLVVLIWSIGVRHPLSWVSLLVMGLPMLALFWFLCVAYLGGLAGEPF